MSKLIRRAYFFLKTLRAVAKSLNTFHLLPHSYLLHGKNSQAKERSHGNICDYLTRPSEIRYQHVLLKIHTDYERIYQIYLKKISAAVFQKNTQMRTVRHTGMLSYSMDSTCLRRLELGLRGLEWRFLTLTESE